MKKNEALPAAELSIFCSQVAMFLEAGMPIYEGIRTMCENSGKSEYGSVYERLNAQVEELTYGAELLGCPKAIPALLGNDAGIIGAAYI